MENLVLNDGKKRIVINSDPNRMIEFDPNDVLFAEHFYEVYRELEARRAEFEAQAAVIDERNKSATAEELAAATPESITFMREFCDFMRERIDRLFGPGTSDKAFGESRNIGLIVQFLEGMTQFIRGARTEKINQYTPRRKAAK